MIQMSDKLTMEQISKNIENYLIQASLTDQEKVNILLKMAQKYQHMSNLPSSHFQMLQTDDPSFQFVKLEYTPPRHDFMCTETGFLQLSSASRYNPSSGKANIHRLSSELKVLSSGMSAERVREDRKRKKQKIKQLLQKTSACFMVLLEAIKKAFSHLVCLKLGKGKKFQMEAIYLNSFEAYLQDYCQKQKLARSTQEIIEAKMRLCDFLIEKMPLFQKKFIDPSQQVSLPLPSKLFKSLFP